MGAVATTEQAIINEAHQRGFVVPDRDRSERQNTQAAGAYVAFPKKGYHEWVGSMDLNSLYPSVFRALNMAPETIVGQLRQDYTEEEITNKMTLEKKSFADAWLGKFGSNEYEFVMSRDVDHKMHLDMEDGTSVEVTGADVYNLIFNSGQPWNISANGTIFKTDFQGIVPGLLDVGMQNVKHYKQKRKRQSQMKRLHFGIKDSWLKRLTLTVCMVLFLIQDVDSSTKELDKAQHSQEEQLLNTWGPRQIVCLPETMITQEIRLYMEIQTQYISPPYLHCLMALV